MNMRELAFSARGVEAVRAVLALEHLDATSTTATELDARNSLFKCTHCCTPEQDFVYTWRGCVRLDLYRDLEKLILALGGTLSCRGQTYSAVLVSHSNHRGCVACGRRSFPLAVGA
jgi:hypothetical protein